MSVYDVVAGVDSETLNEFVSLVYAELYSESKLLTNSLEMHDNEWGIRRFDYDITAPPVITLTPAGSATESPSGVRQSADSPAAANVAPGAREAVPHLSPTAPTASFIVHCRRVDLNIVVADQGEVKVASAVTAELVVRNDTEKGILRVNVDRVGIDIPGEPKSTQLLAVLNKLIAPRLCGWLNSLIEPVAVPPLQLPSVMSSGIITLGRLLPVTQESHLLAFSALEVTPEVVPNPSDWPQRSVFFGADSNVLLRIGNAVLPSGVTSGFNWRIISGSYHLAFGPISEVKLNVNSTARIRIRVRVSADLAIRMPWPLWSVSRIKPTAIIDLWATARASVADDKLVVTVDRFDDFGVDLELGRIPKKFMGLLDQFGLARALGNSIASALGATLSGLKFEVLRLPSIPLKLAGERYQITIKEVQTRCAPGLDRDMILFATGSPAFSAAGSAT